MNAVLSIAGADAAERTRRFAFLVVIIAALYAGYLYVPDVTAKYHTVIVYGHVGVYNSAFYGATIAALTGGFLTMFGFFLVRGAIERDAECGVDGIVGASPVRKLSFVLGKWLSNAAVLWAVAGITYFAAMVMEMLRGHTFAVDVMGYLSPFLCISVPAMAFVAAIAILFDVIPIIRGILGGVVFIFLWGALLAIPVASRDAGTVSPVDPLGFTIISANLINAERAAYPVDLNHDVNFGMLFGEHSHGKPFLFTGFHWTATMIAQRAAWLLAAIALAALASMLFDRFRREGARGRNKLFVDVARLVPNVPFLRIFRAEFGLVASGASVWWYLGAVGLIVAGAFVPFENLAKAVLPFALIWPLERISALGARERRYGVGDQLVATPGFATKTLFFQWLAGTTLTLIVCASCIARFAFAGHPLAILACIAVAAAMSALALGLGTTFGVSRVFEATFVILWYLGPIQHVPGFDFAGNMLSAPLALATVCAVLTLAGLAARYLSLRQRTG